MTTKINKLTLSIGIRASGSKKFESNASSGGGGGTDESGRIGKSQDGTLDIGGGNWLR